MPRVTVPDKTVGDIFTEQMWDAYIRDNFNIGTWTPIADTTLGVAAANIDFQSIPTSFAHLILMGSLNGSVALDISLLVRFNNDSATNYHWQRVRGNAATTTSNEGLAQTALDIGFLTNAANRFDPFLAFIPNYASATHKTLFALNGHHTSTTTGTLTTLISSGVWVNTTAINRVTILPGSANINAGSRVTLYGIPYI